MEDALVQRPKLAQIAEVAGVSVPTVSRVINNHADVSATTRERVERVLREYRYFANNNIEEKNNKKKYSGMIDVKVFTLESPYEQEIVRAVAGVIDSTPYRLSLSLTQNKQSERDWIARLKDDPVTGVVLVLVDTKSLSFKELKKRKTPFVVIDPRGELEPDTPSVGATNWAGARTATQHLLSLGHQRIAMIWGPLKSIRDRLAGYRSALEEAGIPFDPLLTRYSELNTNAAITATEELLNLPDPPTAIFASNDLQAAGVYRALYTHGLSVPTDMSVIGFDDVSLAAQLTPGLTTIRQPLFEMGKLATAMLLQLIAGETLTSTRIELATPLVKRGSCAPLVSR